MLLRLLVTTALALPVTVVHDGFEAGPAWGAFEEIVNGSPCYGAGLADVRAATEGAFAGDRGLVVEANAPGSRLSNHVIAARRLSPPDAGLVTYLAHARVPSASSLEAGPEMSVQLTRATGAGHETLIAGVQFVANPWVAPSWNIWAEVAPGVAAWRSVHDAALPRDAWHAIALTADLDAARYVSLVVAGSDATTTLDLRHVPIARESRFHEEALWITLEAENLWTNCGAAPPSRASVHYDEVALTAARSG